jgi:mono/diheme cytochrome c family protein
MFSRTAAGLLAVAGLVAGARAQETSDRTAPAAHHALVTTYCLTCHNDRLRSGGLDLDAINGATLNDHRDVWEKVVRKLRARQMPPVGTRRPDETTYNAALASLETALDSLAAAAPNPGRTATFRRLTRTEYRNAVADLLTLQPDVDSLLPSDSSSYGFDNVTVANLSPTLLERYVSAAEKISRLAVGRRGLSVSGSTVRIQPDLTQEEHVEGLPIGTRGGALVHHTFPYDGQYEITIRLARDRNEHVEGLSEPHDVELLLDGARVQGFTVEPPPIQKEHDLNYQPSQDTLDAHLKVRVPVAAGPHALGVTFPKKPSVLLETARQPYQAHFNYYRHPRLQPAVYEVSIVGPYAAVGPGDTPSRRRVFVCRPSRPDEGHGTGAAGVESGAGRRAPAEQDRGVGAPGVEENACAGRMLLTLMRRAYRRPVTDKDLGKPFELYRAARDAAGKAGDTNGFEAGIEMGLAAVLVSPEFLFRVEHDPAGVPAGTPYRIDDLELASRLSFFLWGSIPDDELLDVAARGDLGKADVLERQVRRMLADERSRNLVTNFASQWLHLRNLDAIAPDMRLFPDFDDNLRQAFRQETELLIDSVMREDRSVLDLLRADYTFVNERLARHYSIPNVYGSRFRRITFDKDRGAAAPGVINPRGGLLRHGSILLVTSYATRTSPVIRGKWILDNLLGVPPPPPPPNVPALADAPTIGAAVPMRERLAQHRANPVCASCHRQMDPVGFALEHYDAVGRWRTVEAGAPIDASGTLFDGTAVNGVADLEAALLRRPELFVGTIVEKLLTFANGRGIEYDDAPAVRRIMREARAQDYRFSSLVIGVVTSVPFRMRTAS